MADDEQGVPVPDRPTKDEKVKEITEYRGPMAFLILFMAFAGAMTGDPAFWFVATAFLVIWNYGQDYLIEKGVLDE